MHNFFLTALILFSSVLISSGTAAEKYALLVGVTKYNDSNMNTKVLKYPEVDAIAVSELLKESGYTVDLLIGKQATKKAVDTALERVAKEGNADGVVFIGLFGHGVEYGGNAYYGPFDTTCRKVTDSAGQSLYKDGKLMIEPDPKAMISMRSLLDALTLSPAGNKVLIADCCREDPSAARGRAFGSNVKVADLPDNTAALFACKASEQAFEHDDWKHGAFTKSFLEQCEVLLSSRGKVRITSLFGPVHDSVVALVSEKNNGNSRQTVNLAKSNIGLVDLQLVRLDFKPAVSSQPAMKKPSVNEASLKLITNGIGLKLALIPEGEFLMGSGSSVAEPLKKFDVDLEFMKKELPQHLVQITQPYYMQTTEVTRKQWTAVMSSEPWSGGLVYANHSSKTPANHITWLDAMEFCRKLTESERRSGRLTTNQKYTLPTEAQWEYACRAGSDTLYSFGNNDSKLSEYAWLSENYTDNSGFEFPLGEISINDAGQKNPNKFGLHDMHGNVFEWCNDFFAEDYYKASPTENPTGPTSGASRVIRGGASTFSARSAFRSGRIPDEKSYDQGFRVVLE